MLTSTDPIADMLTRIRNGLMIKAPAVVVPFSKTKKAIADVLAEAGWLGRVTLSGDPVRSISIGLKYDDAHQSVIRSIHRISRPGRRVYAGRSALPIVANYQGTAVVSTSAGMMTSREARRRRLGGEVICEVY